MAAEKKPVTATDTAGFVVPDKGVYGGVVTTTANLLSGTDEHHPSTQGMRFSRWYFGPSASANDIDTADYWTSNIKGIVALAWQPADATDDKVSPTLTTAATGLITFTAENATNNEGWLWVLSAG